MCKSQIIFIVLAALLLPAAAWTQAPAISSGGVVHGASYSPLAAEGAVVSIFGENLAADTEQAQSLPLPSQIAGVSVEIVSADTVINAPIYFVSPGQINAQLPYGLTGDSVDVRVVTAAGTSNTETLALAARAPGLFTFSQLGQGRVAALNANKETIATNLPAVPGNMVSLFLTGLGAVDPPLPAGSPAGDNTPGNPWNIVPADANTKVLIGGVKAPGQTFVGLAPFLTGLYQIDFRMPYHEIKGDLSVQVESGGVLSPDGPFIPTVANGYYYAVPAGKVVNGQTTNGVGDENGSLAYSHLGDNTWKDLGDTGLRAWTKDTGLNETFAPITGLALTLMDGDQIVYDNNGIETGSTENFYDNRGGGPDAVKPGLASLYSNSVRDAYVFAGHFVLTEDTTITKLIGYFDGLGQVSLLTFDPYNHFNTFRMNIHSNGADNMPATWTEGFYGDLLSSDPAAPGFKSGTVEISDTGIVRGFQGGTTKPIFRVVYTLDQPFSLPAGDYWFSHDLKVPDAPGLVPVETESGIKTKARGDHKVHPTTPILMTP